MTTSAVWIKQRLKRAWLGKDFSEALATQGSAEVVGLRRMADEHLIFSAVENSAFGAALISPEGRLLKVNQALCQMLGYQAQEILSLGIQGITHPGDPHDLIQLQQLLAGTESLCHSEKRYLHKLGHAVQVRSSIWLIRDSSGQPLYFMCQVQNVSGNKLVEDALYRNHNLLQGIIEGTPDVIFVKDRRGRYVVVNSAGAQLLGKPREEIPGKSDLELLSLEDARRTVNLDQQVIERGEANTYELALTVEGVTRAFLFTKTPYRNHEGEILGLVVVARDITEHQRAAENLENSRSELRALSAQLQSVREEERMRIAREIHDELGQVLTGLKMDVVSLARRMADAQAQADWQHLQERAQSIAVLINNAILTVRKISTELRPGLLDAVGLTAAIEWQAQEFEKRTGIKCELHLPQSNIALDQNRAVAIFRIFQEILTNVTRHAQATKVSVLLEERDKHLFLEARDNGRGIRASEFSNPKSLGLLGMRERALLLGGEFNIRGARGKGTSITVRIPLEEQAGKHAPGVSPTNI
ncbi:MAG TPA: PAS domain S-box protein [Blastocatellia bacterium]|nr:PAS domain S-box protein [Blastocatellia bacterium]HMX26123.1 PAS domain S-box protein [Blastocatellia bacterium]HNG29817.1 PAS domain S-box protein [Blastocatellia bacterium]